MDSKPCGLDCYMYLVQVRQALFAGSSLQFHFLQLISYSCCLFRTGWRATTPLA